MNEVVDMAQLWASIAEAALNFIVVSSISGSNQKQTVTDMKTDLRTTKEDIMAELKTSRELLSNIQKEQTNGRTEE